MQALAQRGKQQVINAGDAGQCQFALSQATQEDVVGDEVELRNQQGAGNGQCHPQNLAVAAVQSQVRFHARFMPCGCTVTLKQGMIAQPIQTPEIP